MFVFMEASSICFRKIKCIKFGKKEKKQCRKSKRTNKQTKQNCISTLLVEFDLEGNHFPYSMKKDLLKTEPKTTETGVY